MLNVKAVILFLFILNTPSLASSEVCDEFSSENNEYYDISYPEIQNLRNFYFKSGRIASKKNHIPLELSCIDEKIKEVLFTKNNRKISNIFKIQLRENGWYIVYHKDPENKILKAHYKGEYTKITNLIINKFKLNLNPRNLRLIPNKDCLKNCKSENLSTQGYTYINSISELMLTKALKTNPCFVTGCTAPGKNPPSTALEADDFSVMLDRGDIRFELFFKDSKIIEPFQEVTKKSNPWSQHDIDSAAEAWSKINLNPKMPKVEVYQNYMKIPSGNSKTNGFYIELSPEKLNDLLKIDNYSDILKNDNILYRTEQGFKSLQDEFNGDFVIEKILSD